MTLQELIDKWNSEGKTKEAGKLENAAELTPDVVSMLFTEKARDPSDPLYNPYLAQMTDAQVMQTAYQIAGDCATRK